MRKRAGLLAAGSVVSLLAVLCLTPGAATQHVKNMAAGDQPQKRGAETATITSVLASTPGGAGMISMSRPFGISWWTPMEARGP